LNFLDFFSPLTGFLGPSRKSIAVPKDNLMSFDSPMTSKATDNMGLLTASYTPLKQQDDEERTPRRSCRLSSAKKINYKH
jgi:hypothetical protein